MKYRNICIPEVEKVPGYDGEPSGLYQCKIASGHIINYHLSFNHEGFVTAYSNPWKVAFFDELRSKDDNIEGCPNGIAFPASFKILKKIRGGVVGNTRGPGP